jgi:hypothetical protein
MQDLTPARACARACGLGARFSANQKAVYKAVLEGRVILSEAVAKTLEISAGRHATALALHAAAGSRAMGQLARYFGVRALGAVAVMGSATFAIGAEAAMYSNPGDPYSDCVGCIGGGR